jgi:3-deoxy-D-manno-octulosonic-acid transferase
MSQTIGLTAYLAVARREPARRQSFDSVRPEGEVIWLHCSDRDQICRVAQVGLRLVAQRHGVKLLLTTSKASGPPESIPPGVIWQEAPSENPSDIKRFLRHWSPDLCLWLGPWLRPALISGAAKLRIPMVLLDADEVGLENKRWRWLPEPTRGSLRLFSHILANSQVAENRLSRMGLGATKVVASGPLLEEAPALPCSDSDLEDLTTTLAGRPNWLAAHVQNSEISTILQAHKAVTRMSHRMLLIIAPSDPALVDEITSQSKLLGWRVGNWDAGDMPEEATQVLIAPTIEELGLWYRIAPVTVMCSSLNGGHRGRNPFEAAALGSAILYGPGVGRHLQAYSRLAQAGSARIINDVDSLVTALGQLMAPDRAATMAFAGWSVVSEGAEISDQIVDLAQQVLDKQEANA